MITVRSVATLATALFSACVADRRPTRPQRDGDCRPSTVRSMDRTADPDRFQPGTGARTGRGGGRPKLLIVTRGVHTRVDRMPGRPRPAWMAIAVGLECRRSRRRGPKKSLA